MSVRGPAIAVAMLLILTGCGKAASGCARAALEHPPHSFNSGSAAREFPAGRSLESSPRSTSESHHDGFGHKVLEEGGRKAVEEGIKHRDSDDTKRDEHRYITQDAAKLYNETKSVNERSLRGLEIQR